MLVEVALSQGTLVAAHSHPHEQVTYVVHGTIRLVVDDVLSVLHAGESRLIAPDVEHSVVALSDARVLDAFSPPRKDF